MNNNHSMPSSEIKDKSKIAVKCFDCGKDIYVTYGWYRRKASDYHWRCPECMKLYRSKIQKNSDTNIANIIKTKMNDPKESEKYRKELSERALSKWNKLSDDEKKEFINKLHTGHKKHYENLSQEEKNNIAVYAKKYFQNRSEEEKEKVSKTISEGRKKFFENNPDALNKMSIDGKNQWKNKSEKEKQEYSKRTIQQWKNMNEEELKMMKDHLKKISKDRWENITDEERKAFSNKISKSWNNKTDEEKESKIQKIRERWINMTEEEKKDNIRKTVLSSSGNNNLHKRFERQFSESHLCNLYHIEPEYPSVNDGVLHCWDYGIFNDDNELCMLVDIDGAYYHADICDYDGLHSHEEYDEQRGLSIPDGVKNCIINEFNFAKCFDYMCKTLIMNYDEYVELMFKECRSMPFPYPRYSDKELLNSYMQLQKMNCNDKYHQNIALNTRVGDHLIQHFHHSIWHANVHGSRSPYEAWQDDELLYKIIKNRIIYQTYMNPNKILQGFNITKKATKVSVFSAGRAKMIINKYLSEYNEIFDPFSGFSGRMLGAVSLGKRYIGQDLSEVHVRESNEIIDFLNKYGIKIDATIHCSDSASTQGTYECLFTCPPYGNKEEWEDVSTTLKCDDWIDICLRNYKCKRYVFVVDETNKYERYIIDIIRNKSHFGSNNEKIIVIDKED